MGARARGSRGLAGNGGGTRERAATMRTTKEGAEDEEDVVDEEREWPAEDEDDWLAEDEDDWLAKGEGERSYGALISERINSTSNKTYNK